MRYRIALALAFAAILTLGLVPAFPLSSAGPVAADQVAGPYVGLWTTADPAQTARSSFAFLRNIED